MPTINMQIEGKVFNSVYRPYLGYTAPLEIFYGGSSSGKSYFLAQRCVLDMIQGGHNYLILRKVANTVRRSVYNEITKAISFFKLDKYFDANKTDMVITCKNGFQILFAGLDDAEKVKSITPAKGVITDAWFEEGTESEYQDIQQLDKRLRGKSKVKKRIILSFNPIYQTHWIYTTYFQGNWDDKSKTYKDNHLFILKTTYKDNNFLTEDDIERLENTKDAYYRDVYLNGNWGILGKAIFRNWEVEDLREKLDAFSSFNNACDFGYAEDPAALVRCHYDRPKMTLYLLQAKYCYGMTNDLLASEIKNMCNREVIVCDSSEPKSIQELRQNGVTAVPAIKGKDSVNFGIQWLQKLNIIIDKRLIDAINEFTIYKWQEDKDGNALPKPVDKNNHCLTGDTIVNTIDGDIPIADLVNKTGWVYCWDETNLRATMSEFFDCRKTQENVDVYEIEMEDGRTIKATDYHPLLTQRGWVMLKDLTLNDNILDIHNHN